jgi:hypothetical protein
MEHHTSTTTPGCPPQPRVSRAKLAAIDNIGMIPRVIENNQYDDKDGLRTYGDDQDHNREPPVSLMLLLPPWTFLPIID